MTKMLASVRNLAEAVLAYEAGADWIDVKDPQAGALGAAPPAVVSAIVGWIDGRCPVSATIGDTWTDAALIPARVAAMSATGVDFVKAGLRAHAPAPATLAAIRQAVALPAALIIVCEAEHPPHAADLAQLAATGIKGIMLDTADKSGRRLPELLSGTQMRGFVSAARDLGLLSGLAGRLACEDIAVLTACGADYLGFRSALCVNGARREAVVEQAIKRVRTTLSAASAKLQQTTSEVA